MHATDIGLPLFESDDRDKFSLYNLVDVREHSNDKSATKYSNSTGPEHGSAKEIEKIGRGLFLGTRSFEL